MQDFARALAFEQWCKRRSAEEVVELPCGHAYLNATFGRSHENNHIVVESFDPAPQAAELAALADRMLTTRGRHRRIDVLSAEHGSRLAPGFEAIGWKTSVMMFMAQVREPDDRIALDAEEVTWAELRSHEEAIVRTRPWATDEGVVRELVERHGPKVETVNARFFAKRHGGAVVSSCHLYSDGRTAQIESVATDEAHVRRGFARAVCARAAAEARAAGHDLVFLVADPRYFAKDLYASLGFDEIGRTYTFDEPM